MRSVNDIGGFCVSEVGCYSGLENGLSQKLQDELLLIRPVEFPIEPRQTQGAHGGLILPAR